ncbi:MAG: Clp protease N-terminal domain-containing protein, partial [Coriobacteriales bacterium]|nr:Clp protease N-terminal domain-containing protein [Coriobacteriales bacterium]
MRPDKFSYSAAEVLQVTMGIAADAQAPAMAPVHLLAALLDADERNIAAIIERIGADPATIRTQVQDVIDRAPKVSGDTAGTNMTQDLMRAINEAEKVADKLGDAYTTTEHLLCGIADSKTEAGTILKNAGVTKKRILDALEELRGDERVTSQDAKPQFKALEQYGRNVTDLARQGKLDPVIGR